MCQSYKTTATWSEFQRDVSHCRDLLVYQHLVGFHLVVRPQTFHHRTNQLFFSYSDVLSVTTFPSRLSVLLCSFLLHGGGNVCRLGREERRWHREKAALCSPHMFATLPSKHVSLWLENHNDHRSLHLPSFSHSNSKRPKKCASAWLLVYYEVLTHWGTLDRTQTSAVMRKQFLNQQPVNNLRTKT